MFHLNSTLEIQNQSFTVYLQLFLTVMFNPHFQRNRLLGKMKFSPKTANLRRFYTIILNFSWHTHFYTNGHLEQWKPYPLSHISQNSILSSSAGSLHWMQVLQSVHCQSYRLMWGTMSSVRSKQLGWPIQESKQERNNYYALLKDRDSACSLMGEMKNAY